MTYQNLQELLSGFTFNQISLVEKEKIIFNDEVRKICEGNGCGRYGKTWMCPPGVGPIAVWKERVLSFKNAVMFNEVGTIEDSFDFEGMMEIGQKFDDKVRGIKKTLEDSGLDFMIFGAGSCHLCEKCSYPDAPCKRPGDTVPSMEACGMFVAQIAEPCGFKYINGTNTVTYFALIMYN